MDKSTMEKMNEVLQVIDEIEWFDTSFKVKSGQLKRTGDCFDIIEMYEHIYVSVLSHALNYETIFKFDKYGNLETIFSPDEGLLKIEMEG